MLKRKLSFNNGSRNCPPAKKIKALFHTPLDYIHYELFGVQPCAVLCKVQEINAIWQGLHRQINGNAGGVVPPPYQLAEAVVEGKLSLV
jgi:hypothetical protein